MSWVFLRHIDRAYTCRTVRSAFFAIRPSFTVKDNNGIKIALNFSESNLEKNGSELLHYKSIRARVFEGSEFSSIIHQPGGVLMTPLAEPGVPAGGFKTVGQIRATNAVVFRRDQNAMGIAVELLSSHTPGAPVVDERGAFIGFISEFDILRALEAKKDLNRLTAEDVMAKDHIAVTEETSFDEAVRIMEEKRLLNLPVKKNGKVAYSVTRHDLLRAWIGLGVSIEDAAG